MLYERIRNCVTSSDDLMTRQLFSLNDNTANIRWLAITGAIKRNIKQLEASFSTLFHNTLQLSLLQRPGSESRWFDKR